MTLQELKQWIMGMYNDDMDLLLKIEQQRPEVLPDVMQEDIKRATLQLQTRIQLFEQIKNRMKW